MVSETTILQSEVLKALRFPMAVGDILRKRQALKRELLKQTNLVPTRIAILGGSTTTEVKSMLEIFLLAQGIEPVFYESGYNRYFEDVLVRKSRSVEFQAQHRFYPHHLAQHIGISRTAGIRGRG